MQRGIRELHGWDLKDELPVAPLARQSLGVHKHLEGRALRLTRGRQGDAHLPAPPPASLQAWPEPDLDRCLDLGGILLRHADYQGAIHVEGQTTEACLLGAFLAFRIWAASGG